MNITQQTIILPKELVTAIKEPWRSNYNYSTNELIEYLREMRKGTYTASTYLLTREIYLQAQERGLIKLPEGVLSGDVHTIPFNQITILNDQINKDE